MNTQKKRVQQFDLIETELRGNLSGMNIPELVQFLELGHRTGELRCIQDPLGTEGHLYFRDGQLESAYVEETEGMEGLGRVFEWTRGQFFFLSDQIAPARNIFLPTQHALLQVVKERDEKVNSATVNILEKGRKSEMKVAKRSSTEIMEDLLKVPGINAVVIIGRDGFVIESSGHSTAVDIDGLGASLAHAINGMEDMGRDLDIGKYQDMFVEYGRSTILCKPVGDSIVALVSPDASKLGIIRHKVKSAVEELAGII
jgi:predicted regulator of Ras-like GTPase activity (Roadblock/LC7/MglB family)